ncbi:MAG: hypothetical protein AAFQ79_07860 [Pseudomonadota bacterium]
MRSALIPAILLWLSAPALAQVAPSEAVAGRVAEASEAWFDLLPSADFEAERGYFTPSLANTMPPARWAEFRRATIARSGGATPRYRGHGLTFYPGDTLRAAVDFWGEAVPGDIYICGYVVWAVPDASQIGLTRMEENIVEVTLFRAMDQDDALQTLTNWRCPDGLVRAILGLSQPEETG